VKDSKVGIENQKTVEDSTAKLSDIYMLLPYKLATVTESLISLAC